MTQTRSYLDLWELDNKIREAVPPVDPEPMHWLHSDSTETFCLEHALAARWKEMPTVGPAPKPSDLSHEWRRSDFEETLLDGIGASYDSSEDNTASCSVCGCTLQYHLTDWGVEEELAHLMEGPLAAVNGETTYWLSRIFSTLQYPDVCQTKLSMAIEIAESALKIIEEKKKENAS